MEFDTAEGRAADAAANACLAGLVQQWVTLSQTVVGPSSGPEDAGRTGWWPPVLELATSDGVLVAPEGPSAPTGQRPLPRRHRRTRAALDSWLAAAIQADCAARRPGHPLVARLRTSGLQFVAFGTTKIPDDVKELCHELVDLSRTRPGHGADLRKHRS